MTKQNWVVSSLFPRLKTGRLVADFGCRRNLAEHLLRRLLHAFAVFGFGVHSQDVDEAFEGLEDYAYVAHSIYDSGARTVLVVLAGFTS